MFDIGFSEMMVIAIVALIVIGPKRLPKVARTIGHLTGRLQRYVNDVKADIDREMEFEELRKFKEQFQDAAQSVEQTIHGEIARTDEALRRIESSTSSSATLQEDNDPAASAPAAHGDAPPSSSDVPRAPQSGSN